MPVKASEHQVRTIDIQVTKTNGDGVLHEDTLKWKYKPITTAWLDKWRAQIEREQEAARLESALLLEQAEVEMQLEAADEAKRAELRVQLEDVNARLEAHRQANPRPEHDILIRQMADILIDVDHLDEQNQPIKPTPEFLSTIDRGLLTEAEEKIQKKLLRPLLT